MSIYTGWLVYTIGNLPNLLQLYKPSFLIDYDLYVKFDTCYNNNNNFHLLRSIEDMSQFYSLTAEI